MAKNFKEKIPNQKTLKRIKKNKYNKNRIN